MLEMEIANFILFEPGLYFDRCLGLADSLDEEDMFLAAVVWQRI